MTTYDPVATPHRLPAVTPAPGHGVDLAGPGGLRAAMQAGAAALDVAEQLGLPEPLHVSVAGSRIEARLLWPDLLRWMGMLRGLRVAGGEHSTYVTGWTETDDKDADGEIVQRRQQWLLRPVNEPDCQRCQDLPEPKRQPLSPAVWRDWRWMDLTGRPWADTPRPQLTAS